MPQNTYNFDQVLGFPGTESHSNARVVFGRKNAHTAELPYGKMVMLAVGSSDSIVPCASGGRLQGMLVQTDHAMATVTGGLRIGEIGNVVSKGQVFATVENTFAVGDPVLVRIDAGGSGAGSIRAGAAVAASLVIVPNARFMNAGIAGALGEIELNMPGVPTLA